MQVGGGSIITVSTEVIIADDDEAEERGREAMEFLTSFITGAGEAATT
jgi:hypothetical protein